MAETRFYRGRHAQAFVHPAEIVIREAQGASSGLQHAPGPGGQDAERQLQFGDGFLQLGMAVELLP